MPDSALGKKVTCKSCGASFRTKAPTATKPQATAKPRQKAAPQPSRDELAEFGIDGPLSKQADIFDGAAEDPRTVRGLGNFAAEDPGFGDATPNKQQSVKASREQTDSEDGLAAILKNPHVKRSEAKKQPSGQTSGGGKKKKREMHPAIKDSLDQATMTLLVLGVLLLLFFGFMYFNAEHDAKVAIKNAGFDEERIDMEGATEMVSSWTKWLYGVGLAIGGTFIGLGFGVQVFPIVCSILALVFYVGLEIFYVIADPLSLVSLWHWARRIVVCGALGKAFMDALNARSYEKMMAERGR